MVLVHRNRAQACLESIDAYRRQELPVRIVVVDSGSEADQLALVRSAVEGDDRVEIVPVGENIGFGPGANVGLRKWLSGPADGEWVAVAPHDAVPEADCLAMSIAELARRPRAGLACADVGDGCTPVLDPYFGGILKAAERTSGWEDADHPHGTLLFARRACLEEVGLFDERFFAYCEEADLALRARARGWQVGLIRGALVRNPDLGSSVPVVDYLQHRNTLLLVREMSGRYHAFIRFCISVLHLVRGLLQPSRRPPVFSAPARILAMRDYLRSRFGAPPPDLFTRPDSPGTPDPG